MADTEELRAEALLPLSPRERLERVARVTGLGSAARDQLSRPSSLDEDIANHMIENMISTIAIPVGVATGLLVDGRETLAPLATEETSIVGFVSMAAELCRETGGFTTSATDPLMIAQVQLHGASDPAGVRLKVLEKREEIRALCDGCDSVLRSVGGGFRDLEVFLRDTPEGVMVVVHLLIDTRDAMGANTVNTMAERVAPSLEDWTGTKALLRILSNLADRRLVRARASWRPEAIGGEGVRDAIVSASRFAQVDPYRATTQNKGTMNGISAVVLATGNDTRAIEAGAHAYAARDGQYRSLTRWDVDGEGNLSGTIELPMAVGTVGGATRVHPTAKALLELTGVTSASGLGRLIAAVGLAQNFAALHALCTKGIQAGHMTRHAANVAMEAGATGPEVTRIAQEMVRLGTVSAEAARRLLNA